jgi:hypothetical protein
LKNRFIISFITPTKESLMLNPLNNLLTLVNISQSDLIEALDDRTEEYFCNLCAKNIDRKDDISVDDIKKQAAETFKWWNPGH